jgi:hypothetical protein
MDSNAAPPRTPTVMRHRNVDGTANRPQQTPKSCSGRVAQNRPLPTCQDRCHPPTVKIDRLMPNGVDAAVDAVQPT